MWQLILHVKMLVKSLEKSKRFLNFFSTRFLMFSNTYQVWNFKFLVHVWSCINVFWKHSDLCTMLARTWVLLVIKQSRRTMGLTHDYDIAWMWWPATTLGVQYLRLLNLRGGNPMDYLWFSQILILIHKP
jgi:uncharacterized protein VirK/YbjX